MESYPPPYQEPTFEPSAEQLERDRILRRRNRLYIYLPLSIISLISIVLIVLILIGIFAPGIVGTEVFISAVADIIIILWTIPAMIIVAILPVSYFAYLMNRREKRKLDPQTGPLAYRSRIQVFLWRIQLFMNGAQLKTDELAPKVAKPVTDFNAYLTYLGAWLNILIRPLRRSAQDDQEREQWNTKHERDQSG